MIPNRFHFVFRPKRKPQPFHLVHYRCLASCIRVNAPAAIYLYYHHEPYGRYWDLIRERIIPVRIPRVAFVDGFQYTDWEVARYEYTEARGVYTQRLPVPVPFGLSRFRYAQVNCVTI